MPKTGGNVRMPSSIKQSSSNSGAVAARVLTKAEKDRLRVERGTGLSQVTGGVSPVPVLQPQQPFEWHKITGTESVGSIAGMYGMDPQTLVGFNGLNLNPPAGSWIKIPQVKTNQLSTPTTPQNLTPSVQVPSAMPQTPGSSTQVPQNMLPGLTPFPLTQYQEPSASGAGNVKFIRHVTPTAQEIVQPAGILPIEPKPSVPYTGNPDDPNTQLWRDYWNNPQRWVEQAYLDAHAPFPGFFSKPGAGPFRTLREARLYQKAHGVGGIRSQGMIEPESAPAAPSSEPASSVGNIGISSSIWRIGV